MMRAKRDSVIYSPQFREAVLTAYPGDSGIRELLDRNAYFLGRYLDDGCSGRVSFSAEELLVLIGTMSSSDLIANLVDLATKEKLKVQAYRMWDKEWFYEE